MNQENNNFWDFFNFALSLIALGCSIIALFL